MSKIIETVLAPINLGICNKGKIDRRFSNFYIERSGRGIDLTYIGNVAISERYRTNNYTPLFLAENIDEWTFLIRNIKENESLAGVQLGCRYYNDIPVKKINDNDKEEKTNKIISFVSSLTNQEIENVIKGFISQAKIAIDLGFDYIQIHAAHGYFLSLLLSENLNLRTDKYNQKDGLFIYEIFEGIKKYSSTIKVDLRVSFIEGITNENVEVSQSLLRLKLLSQIGFNMISISNGIYDISKSYIYPSLDKGFYPMLKYEESILKINKNLNWNFCGNINDIKMIKSLKRNDKRSISIGRPLIANPNFLIQNKLKIKNNCDGCGECHYYTYGRRGLVCPKYEATYNKPLLRDVL